MQVREDNKWKSRTLNSVRELMDHFIDTGKKHIFSSAFVVAPDLGKIEKLFVVAEYYMQHLRNAPKPEDNKNISERTRAFSIV